MQMEIGDGNHISGDGCDARSLFEKTFGLFSHKNVAKSNLHVDDDLYDMSHKERGKCVIFNQRDFDAHTQLNSRGGTDVDADRLYQRFRELDFSVVIHKNLSSSKILDEIETIAKHDFSNEDCFVCCILSHGEEGSVYGRDGKLAIEMIISQFRGDVCPTLAGKPKIFFIQACQGDKLDHGINIHHSKVVTDSVFRIPTHADFLVAYSTVPGFYSWRNTSQGSWFIQGLCSALQKYGQTVDLLNIMAVVNRFVAYGFESNVPNDVSMDKKKQVPFITYTLTRKILFKPKF